MERMIDEIEDRKIGIIDNDGIIRSPKLKFRN